jgi:PAS domain S-box-containing protein
MSKRYSDIADYVNKRGFYEAVVEDGADIIFVVDYFGTILYHNPSVQETLGYPPKSLIDCKFFDHVHQDSREELQQQFKQCISEPYADNIEFKFLKSDGSISYLEFNSVNLNHKEGIDGLVLDCRDINQRKEDAQELLRAQKAKERFMANMSHEIRTPINGIAGMIALLAETNVTDEQKKYINAIKTSTDNLKVIINDILDISVIESGKLKFETIGFNIRHQLQSIIDTFLHQAREKNIYLNHTVADDLDLVVLGDPVRLYQILINLISNALKFTDKGGIQVNISCSKKEGNELIATFEVIDTGIGIAEEKLETIFESFSQADESVTRRYGGTGLGLAISKQLVELQNGTISVSSSENNGTSFTFSIPYQVGEDKDLVIEKEQLNVSDQEFDSLESIKILLVEDNDINRMYAANILKKWDCQFDIAENGYIATEKLKKEPYDLILMDIQMPVMDGMEATKVIRQNFPSPINKTPIIALTANVLKGDPEKYIKAGMNGHLSKPFLPKSLYNSIIEHTTDAKPKVDKIIASDKKENPITNLSFLRKMSNNDDTFIKELIILFLESTPTLIEEMKDHYQKKHWKELSGTAHQMKPSVKLMGLIDMHEVAKQLENDSLETDKSSLEPAINKISTYFDIAKGELEAEIKNRV